MFANAQDVTYSPSSAAVFWHYCIHPWARSVKHCHTATERDGSLRPLSAEIVVAVPLSNQQWRWALKISTDTVLVLYFVIFLVLFKAYIRRLAIELTYCSLCQLRASQVNICLQAADRVTFSYHFSSKFVTQINVTCLPENIKLYGEPVLTSLVSRSFLAGLSLNGKGQFREIRPSLIDAGSAPKPDCDC